MDGMSGDHNGTMAMPGGGNGTMGHDGMQHGQGHGHGMMMMHMTLYWGKSALVLFQGWPGNRAGMYVLSLVLVFALAVLVEFISHSRLVKSGSSHVAAGLVRTALHTVRMGLAYLLMLALMSFNGGVFIAGVAGHGIGFLVFGSRVFSRPDDEKHTNDRLPPISC
ncbi:hypothetical protein Syun_000419 [Stephania yunnanensis]|uniref:Copper transport protein n=1 Tax=Stephania yunnanensis TaxID=152371 RepID=A0AAP0Q6S1_9MAGN